VLSADYPHPPPVPEHSAPVLKFCVICSATIRDPTEEPRVWESSRRPAYTSLSPEKAIDHF
jgi:hypothetical protein